MYFTLRSIFYHSSQKCKNDAFRCKLMFNDRGKAEVKKLVWIEKPLLNLVMNYNFHSIARYIKLTTTQS